MQAASIYRQNDAYFAAIEKLETIARNFDPADPNDLRSAIIQAVGEDLDIWPEECAAPPIPAAEENAAAEAAITVTGNTSVELELSRPSPEPECTTGEALTVPMMIGQSR